MIEYFLPVNNAIKAELALIKNAITAHIQPHAIYLFGSYAYGQPTPESDIDIYVVIPDTEIDIIELGADIRYALYKKLPQPVDILIGKQSAFEKRCAGLTLENTIANQGVLIYG